MGQTSRTVRSDRLLRIMDEASNMLVVMHDNPDPDAIASGWAVRYLIQEKLGKKARVIAGGAIVRAENRHMVKLLKPPIELIDELDVDEDTAAVLVDCSATTTNHLLASSHIDPVGVIDHHQFTGPRVRLAFRDTRPNVAASATITASYLLEQQLAPASDLATALLYAISTETQGGETYYSALDRRVVAWLSDKADLAKLAEIESAPLTRTYYSDLVLALQSTFVYDSAAICFLPQAEGIEVVGEIGDLLVRCEPIKQVLCATVIDDAMFLSVRTDRDAGNASDLIRKAIAGLGGSGGHQHRAGGKIRLSQCGLTTEQLYDDLRNRWLETCKVERQRGTRLVRKREIVRHL